MKWDQEVLKVLLVITKFVLSLMVISRNLCDKCMEYMKVEKIGEEYVLVCSNCERILERKDYDSE